MEEILLYCLPYITIAFVATIIFYISTRIAWAFGVSRRPILITIGLLTLGSCIALLMIMRGNSTTTASHFFANSSDVYMVLFINTFSATALLDIVHTFYKYSQRIYRYSLIVLAITLTSYSLLNALNVEVYNVDITIPNLKEPLRIAQVTDTHFGHYWGERRAKEIGELIAKEDVDAIVVTGDMFNSIVRLDSSVIRPFTRLNVPIYYVEGNYDDNYGEVDIKRFLRRNGVIVLENEKVEFKGLQIVGLEHLIPDSNTVDILYGAHTDKTMQDVLPTLNIDKDRASILLNHVPYGAKYAAENGINLFLAGHTHGGQLFPGNYLAGTMYEYVKGLHKYDDNMQIYVSQGIGTIGPPIRFGADSELTIINLKGSSKNS